MMFARRQFGEDDEGRTSTLVRPQQLIGKTTTLMVFKWFCLFGLSALASWYVENWKSKTFGFWLNDGCMLPFWIISGEFTKEKKTDGDVCTDWTTSTDFCTNLFWASSVLCFTKNQLN